MEAMRGAPRYIVLGSAPASESDSSQSTREIAGFGRELIKDLWSESCSLRGTI